MSNSDSESKYPLTTEFIYSECTKRLKKRKLSLNLTDTDIAGDGEFDRKIVNRIINNTRSRNNPYLIAPAYVRPLVSKLEFHSDREVFWGNENDEQFIETIFCNLITDILEEWEPNDNANVQIIQKVLIDDVQFAKVYSTVMSSFEYVNAQGDYLPISPIDYVNSSEQVSFKVRKQIRQNAILRLFKNTKPLQIFKVFFQETNNCGENKGFSKLDKRLDNFVANYLMPFLRTNMPGQTSLGLRVHSIVSTDMMNYVEIEFIDSERIAAGFDSCITPEYDKILQSRMYAGRDYVNQIETLQVRLDELHRKEQFGG